MNRIFKLALISAISAGSLVAGEVKIGVVLPLSGPVGGYGQAALRGITLAHELQSKLVNGDTIKLIIIDNKSDKIESANAMQRLVSSEKVDAVIGAMTSTNTLAMTKIADDTKTPLVAPAATSDRVTKNRAYVSRVCFADSFQGIVGANLAFNNLKAKHAAILFDSSSDYSIGLTKAFRTQFTKLGGKIELEAQVPAGSKDFKAQLSSVRARNFDVVYIPIYYNEAALIAVQAKQLGLKNTFIGGDGIAADKIFFEVGKDAVDGYLTTDYYSPDPNAKQTTRGDSFIARYTKEYNENKAPVFAAVTADAYDVIVRAMEQCENPKDRECINKNIRTTKDFEGVTGIISINEQGDAIRSAVINEVKNGRLVYKMVIHP
ncbi:MAG: ABC transporter substrate-binding protein [Wolinella sp.]